MTVLVIAFMSCRIYSRTVLTKTLGWDDGIMLLAAVSSIELLRGLCTKSAGHGCRKQYHGHRINAASVSDGLSPLYANILFSEE